MIWTKVHLPLDHRPFPTLPHVLLYHKLSCDKQNWVPSSMDALIPNETMTSSVFLFWRCKCLAPNDLMIWTKQSCSVVEADVVISWKLSLNIVHSGLRVLIITLKNTHKCVQEHVLSELHVGKELVLGDEMSYQSFASIYPAPGFLLLYLPECQLLTVFRSMCCLWGWVNTRVFAFQVCTKSKPWKSYPSIFT